MANRDVNDQLIALWQRIDQLRQELNRLVTTEAATFSNDRQTISEIRVKLAEEQLENYKMRRELDDALAQIVVLTAKVEHLTRRVDQSPEREETAVSESAVRKLRRLMNSAFDLGELEALCVELEATDAVKDGQNVPERVNEIIGYFRRRNDLDQLIVYCTTQRPRHSWPGME